MKSNELNQITDLSEFEDAVKSQDSEKLAAAFANKCKEIEERVLAKHEELKDEHDSRILAQRGVRQLTNEEKEFYNSIFKNDIGMSPTQGGAKIMPQTIFNQIFEDLRNIADDDPLSLIDLVNGTGSTEVMAAIADSPIAAWGDMCDAITKELSVGFRVQETLVNKLSCYLPYCKSLIDLGPEWQDTYVREYMALAIHDALVKAAISGNGQKQPWGMAYNYDPATDTGTIKQAIAITKLDKANFGPLFKVLATNPVMGRARTLVNPTLFVDSATYYDHIYANDSVLTNAGQFTSLLDLMGVKVCVCETGLTAGQAILAMPKRYFMEVAMKSGGAKGKVEFSDEYLFLEDKRVYKAKAFAEGFLKDNNGAVLLDVTGLVPVTANVPEDTEATESI